jgi:glycosyltransferase involved in cell wall biosynthesis
VHGEALVREMLSVEPQLAGRVHSVAHGRLGEAPANSPLPNAGAFLFFGRLQAYKGLGVLLDAADLLAQRGLAFSLAIAGSGPDLEGRRERIAAMPMVQLDERYIPAEEVGGLFDSADAVVMPYLEATQSGIAAYAVSAGRGVIITGVGAMTEVIHDGENGLVIPPNDAVALADAMARIIREPGLAAKLARGAAATADAELSWDKIAADTVKVYQAAIARR